MIYVEDNSIKVGSVILPGLYKSLEIDASVILEDVKVEGTKKIPRQATGYEDHKITLTIELDDSREKTRFEKLTIIQNLFKEPTQDKPKVYPFINYHTQLRGISKVIFKKLNSHENSRNQTIVVSLEFVEYEAINVTVSKESNKNKTSKSGTKKSKKTSVKNLKKSAHTPVATPEYQEYLKNRGKSPSVDNRKVKRMGGASEW